jgi:DNA polymerase-3 subunit alpha
MAQIPTYARGKRDPATVSIPDDRLQTIIASTKGVILYQEQAMRISKELAGFSGAKADDLRKAIGKKNRNAMAALKPEFYAGCEASGTSRNVIDWLWETNERSADYSFNKSHAACYALIAYRTAWLRANYPAEYMAALISSVMDTKDKVPFLAARCEEMGIEILPPDVNLSDHEFVVVEGNIRFGLDAVKGVGHVAVEAIKTARKSGDFGSLWDFCERVDGRAVNRRALEALIKAGAFGSTGDSRKGMLAVLEQAQSAGQQLQQDAEIGQGSIFDLAGADTAGAGPSDGGAAAAFAASTHPPIPAEEFEQGELLASEKEAIGLYISAHPLKQIREALRERCDGSIAELLERRDGDWVTAGGIVTAARKITTRKGDPMMFVTLDDLEANVEMLVFAKVLAEFPGEIKTDDILLVRGRIEHGEAGKRTLISQTVERFEPSEEEVVRAREAAASRASEPPKAAEPMKVRVDASSFVPSVIDELKRVFTGSPGETNVELWIRTSAGLRTLRLGPSYRVADSPSLRAEVDFIVGSAAAQVA